MKKLIIKNAAKQKIIIYSNIYADQSVVNPQVFNDGDQKEIEIKSNNGDIEIRIESQLK